MRRTLTDLLYGTILAAAAAGLSCLMAQVGFGRSYYLAVFLPVSMLGYILVAWFLHLRDDRFFGSPSAMRGGAPKAAAGDRPADNPLPGAARWDEEPIRRQAAAGGAPPHGVKRALLWAAAELAAAATLLYFLWGIGAVYHG